MKRQWRRCGCITLLMLLLHVAWLQPLQAATNDDTTTSTTTKPVWQQTDAKGDNYLSNRRALVGSGCMVNRLGSDGVEVVPVITNLENLCDEDLTNVTTVAAVVDATVAVGPLVSVKDVKNYYAKGTQAGFIISGDASGVLSLSAANFFSIMFYCDGELVGTETVTEGQSVNGVGLSLIQLSSSEASKEYVATAPAKFDEIRLAQTGVIDATVGKTVGIKYAFVGSAKEYTITQASMAEYNSDLTVQSRSSSTTHNSTLAVVTTDWRTGGNLDDDNLENRTTIAALIADAAANVRAYASDDSDAFPAGTTVGIKYHTFTVLNLKVGDVAHINLYNKAGEKVIVLTRSKLDFD